MTDTPTNERTTIFALSSGMGKSGVAIMRLSGPASGKILEAYTGSMPAPRQATLRSIRNPSDNQIIDQGLVLWFPGPRSFSGEDMAEFHVHGGRAVISALIDSLAAQPGLHAAEPGEFTRRAFENGKLDLTETEGLADLINADTEAQRTQALRQMGGHNSEIYEHWRREIIRAQSLIEAEIDFSDEEDVLPEAISAAENLITGLQKEIRHHLEQGRSGEIIRDGFKIVLVGAPNVGKSSLLNVLARRDAAITSSEAGTTRDAIQVFMDLEGWPVEITDTAGLRDTGDISDIEREGMSRSLGHARDADLVIWIIDQTLTSSNAPNTLPDDITNKPHLIIANKSDLGADKATENKKVQPALHVSAKTGDGLEALISHITHIAAENMTRDEAPVITRTRHRQHLDTCHHALGEFLHGKDRELELRAEDLRYAANAIGRITGRIDVEDILDDLFSSFCIGK